MFFLYEIICIVGSKWYYTGQNNEAKREPALLPMDALTYNAPFHQS